MTSASTLPGFQKLTIGIAKALGGTVLKPATTENWWIATIDTPDMPLTLDLRDHEGRVEVKVSWPTYKDQEDNKKIVGARDVGRRVNPTITAALARGAEAIAKDIKRKLIPDAKPLYDAAVAKCREETAYLADKRDTIKRLTKALGVAPRRGIDPGILHVGVACLRVSSAESVRFEAFSVDEQTAIKIVALLRASEGKK